MKKALVCGAGGFIGSYLMKKLKKKSTGLEALISNTPNFLQQLMTNFCSLTSVKNKMLKMP
jgi:nucleoside-diphosphate-sugar epimerase